MTGRPAEGLRSDDPAAETRPAILRPFGEDELARARAADFGTPPEIVDPRVEALVTELIGRVADKWTMLVVEELARGEKLRFTELARRVDGVSQKMLTQTLRRMERDALLVRTVHPVIPPKVEYRLTHLGLSLGAAFCGVWIWAERNLDEIEGARRLFDEKRRSDRSD